MTKEERKLADQVAKEEKRKADIKKKEDAARAKAAKAAAAKAKAASRKGGAAVSEPVSIVFPKRLHLCLSVVSAASETIENHNVFLEAFAEKARACPFLKRILSVRKNVDVLQVAIDLTAGTNPLKVGILNGANRRMIGNHWFSSGATLAIDENLHRRSASMARAALLLNRSVAPTERQPGDLADVVQMLGGKVEMSEGAKPAAATPLSATPLPATPSASGNGLFGCCKKRAKDPGQAATPKPKEPAKSKKAKEQTKTQPKAMAGP